MIIGLLYEGEYDYDPFKKLLVTILKQNDITVDLKIFPYPAYGSIQSKLEDATTLFFADTPKCDVAIFINDMDKKEERCKKIKKFTNNYMRINSTCTIFTLCPNPCFEKWFFIEENAVKKMFGLAGFKQIPYVELEPKSRLKKLIKEYYNDFTKSTMEIYGEIAENLDCKVLSTRDVEFKSFCTEFIKKARLLLI